MRITGGFGKKVGRFFRYKAIPGLLKTSNVIANAASRVPVIGKIAGPVAEKCNNLTQKVGRKVLDYAHRRHGESTENENG